MIDVFLTQVMPKILDVAELKVMLYVFYLLNQKQGFSSFVTYRELSPCVTLIVGMDEKKLRRILKLATDHGILRRIKVKSEEAYEPIPYLTPRESIFTLYEQNIGMITPMIAEELKEAEKVYPEQWIKQAFEEAVVLNKRSWRYISRILERWAGEGKEDGKYRQSFKKNSPNKYIEGKYGHLVKR
jgi:DnaD/phage-associated family protein